MHVLQINSSINGEAGISTQLADSITARLATTITRRDLSATPLPHLDGATFEAFGAAPHERTAEQEKRVALSDELIAELRAADVVVLTAPMYNFGIPSGLKAWIDQIARAGVTFKYTSQGPQGLLGDKRVIVVTTRGGSYAGTDSDNHTPYLLQTLGFLGLGEPELVFVEGLAQSARREEALARAQARIAELAV